MHCVEQILAEKIESLICISNCSSRALEASASVLSTAKAVVKAQGTLVAWVIESVRGGSEKFDPVGSEVFC